jgi:hypothetical protein
MEEEEISGIVVEGMIEAVAVVVEKICVMPNKGKMALNEEILDNNLLLNLQNHLENASLYLPAVQVAPTSHHSNSHR